MTRSPVAVDLARQIAQHPQYCVRNDRRSAYEQWMLTPSEALANEFRLAQDSLAKVDPADGLGCFNGEGK